MDGRFISGVATTLVAIIVIAVVATATGMVLGPVGQRLGGHLDDHLRNIVVQELKSHGLTDSSVLPPPNATRVVTVTLQLRSGDEGDAHAQRSGDWFLTTDRDHIVRICKWAAGAEHLEDGTTTERWRCEEPIVWHVDDAKPLANESIMFDVNAAHVVLEPTRSASQ